MSAIRVYGLQRRNKKGSITHVFLGDDTFAPLPATRDVFKCLWLTTNRAFAERLANTLTLDTNLPVEVYEVKTVGPYDKQGEPRE